jgi:hypothetical protein
MRRRVKEQQENIAKLYSENTMLQAENERLRLLLGFNANKQNERAVPDAKIDVVKVGYLAKRGGKRTNWNTRWFILQWNILVYYKNPLVCVFVIPLHLRSLRLCVSRKTRMYSAFCRRDRMNAANATRIGSKAQGVDLSDQRDRGRKRQARILLCAHDANSCVLHRRSECKRTATLDGCDHLMH